jgi:hypothetical protein
VATRRDVERCEEIGKEVAHAVLHAVTLKITRTPYLAAWEPWRPVRDGENHRGSDFGTSGLTDPRSILCRGVLAGRRYLER